MNIQYTISEKVLSKRLGCNGSTLYSHQVFIYDSKKRILFDQFTREFSLENSSAVEKASKEEAEYRVFKLNQWVRCFNLLSEKYKCLTIIDGKSEAVNSLDIEDYKKNLTLINNQLLDLKEQEEEILFCLNKHRKTIIDISDRWIAENMPVFYPFNRISSDISD